MTFLTVLLVLGSLARFAVLVLRPSAVERFGQPRRRLLATRLEQAGDIVVLATALSMVLFGYGQHPAEALVALWVVMLIAGFTAVLLAHPLARNHRLAARQAR